MHSHGIAAIGAAQKQRKRIRQLHTKQHHVCQRLLQAENPMWHSKVCQHIACKQVVAASVYFPLTRQDPL